MVVNHSLDITLHICFNKKNFVSFWSLNLTSTNDKVQVSPIFSTISWIPHLRQCGIDNQLLAPDVCYSKEMRENFTSLVFSRIFLCATIIF